MQYIHIYILYLYRYTNYYHTSDNINIFSYILKNNISLCCIIFDVIKDLCIIYILLLLVALGLAFGLAYVGVAHGLTGIAGF